MTAPSWAIGPNPAVHDIPGGAVVPTNTISWDQLQAAGQFFLESFIGQVAIAFGGIQIFGWKPFDFLVEWGQQRVEEAAANYAAAIAGQNAANFANSQLAINGAGNLASNVPGGVALSNDCNGPAADNFGWTRVSDGAGAGQFGPNGTGRAVWKKSGGAGRRHIDINPAPLATDYQIVTVVMSVPVQKPYFGSDAYFYLILRANPAGTSFVWARIGDDNVAIGGTVSGLWQLPWEVKTITAAAGNQWQFLCGTDADPREYIVKQNGVERIRFTDRLNFAGVGNRHVGMGAFAADRGAGILPLQDQTVPGEIDTWSAADRPANTY